MGLMGESLTQIVIPVAALVRVIGSGLDGYKDRLIEEDEPEEGIDSEEAVAKCAEIQNAISVGQLSSLHKFLCLVALKGLRSNKVVRNCGLVSGEQALDYELVPSTVEEILDSTTHRLINGSTEGFIAHTGTSASQSRSPSVQTELIMFSIPAIAGQAIEPLALLMETAYIGRMGYVWIVDLDKDLEREKEKIGEMVVAMILLFVRYHKLVFNIPLLSVATSFVAEDISKNISKGSTSEINNSKLLDETDERTALPSVPTALLLALGIGLCEALAMYLGSGLFLNMMGISTASPMHIPAQQFLKLRAIGAPAVVLSLAIQGIFRGFKDTKTPVLCLGKLEDMKTMESETNSIDRAVANLMFSKVHSGGIDLLAAVSSKEEAKGTTKQCNYSLNQPQQPHWHHHTRSSTGDAEVPIFG
ncbi:hypothetical protein HYC85_032168 [Camellia sinensis]|uniref:Uncharacterized protein n=1 Tax=Camellia sinensis TaxID=4442 RepID=A0A7J7FSJ3_CAMSI|nr:hypothetical protein HYC85_032168 [Camellia sinensis]